MSVGKFFAGFVVGGLVGGIIGVLLAPTSGEETREKLAETSGDACKKAEASIKELHDKADDVMEDLQKKGDELLAKVQELIKKEKEA